MKTMSKSTRLSLALAYRKLAFLAVSNEIVPTFLSEGKNCNLVANNSITSKITLTLLEGNPCIENLLNMLAKCKLTAGDKRFIKVMKELLFSDGEIKPLEADEVLNFYREMKLVESTTSANLTHYFTNSQIEELFKELGPVTGKVKILSASMLGKVKAPFNKIGVSETGERLINSWIKGLSVPAAVGHDLDYIRSLNPLIVDLWYLGLYRNWIYLNSQMAVSGLYSHWVDVGFKKEHLKGAELEIAPLLTLNEFLDRTNIFPLIKGVPALWLVLREIEGRYCILGYDSVLMNGNQYRDIKGKGPLLYSLQSEFDKEAGNSNIYDRLVSISQHVKSIVELRGSANIQGGIAPEGADANSLIILLTIYAYTKNTNDAMQVISALQSSKKGFREIAHSVNDLLFDKELKLSIEENILEILGLANDSTGATESKLEYCTPTVRPYKQTVINKDALLAKSKESVPPQKNPMTEEESVSRERRLEINKAISYDAIRSVYEMFPDELVNKPHLTEKMKGIIKQTCLSVPAKCFTPGMFYILLAEICKLRIALEKEETDFLSYEKKSPKTSTRKVNKKVRKSKPNKKN